MRVAAVILDFDEHCAAVEGIGGERRAAGDEAMAGLHRLADSAEHCEILAGFRRQALQRWDFEALDQAVRESQRRRLLVCDALGLGAQTAWDFQPFRDASTQYIRNRADLDDLEASARFPRVRPIA